MTPNGLHVESLLATTFEASDEPNNVYQANEPGCSDCFSTCNLLFSIYGC